jgi:hypothetical protein
MLPLQLGIRVFTPFLVSQPRGFLVRGLNRLALREHSHERPHAAFSLRPHEAARLPRDCAIIAENFNFRARIMRPYRIGRRRILRG